LQIGNYVFELLQNNERNMLKEKNIANQKKNVKQKSRRRMQIGMFFAVILIALAIIFMPKKTTQDAAIVSAAPMFKKQGELKFTKGDDKPIVAIDIEIADDEAKREVGMMGRPEMEERQGMLFIFEEEQMASFWMRNTILSLDMIFIDKHGKIVTIHKNTKPFSDDTYSATEMTLLVLEVNAGFTDKYHIKEGDVVNWKRD
jgi:uncharacterized membrane protein (UPF0127 family)